MKITRTITIDGDTPQEYVQIAAHMDSLADQFPQWSLVKEPLLNRITAVKTEEVEAI